MLLFIQIILASQRYGQGALQCCCLEGAALLDKEKNQSSVEERDTDNMRRLIEC